MNNYLKIAIVIATFSMVSFVNKESVSGPYPVSVCTVPTSSPTNPSFQTFADNEYGPTGFVAGQPTAGNCPNIPATFPNSTLVNSYSGFRQAYNNASPGDAIIIANGTHSWAGNLPNNTTVWIDSVRRNKMLLLNRDGTASAPIYILAENIHSSILSHANTAIAITGKYNVVAGFRSVSSTQFQITGSDNRVACNYFVNSQAYIQTARGQKSSRTEIDNNVIDGSNNFGMVLYACDRSASSCTSQSKNHHVHHNLFTNKPFQNANGHDAIFLGLNYSPINGPFYTDSRMDSVVENNLFDGWDGEEELVSIKTDGNIIRNNCVINAGRSNFFLRDADDTLVTGNWVEGRLEEFNLSGKRAVFAFNYLSLSQGRPAFNLFSLVAYPNNKTGQLGYYHYIDSTDGLLQYNVFNGVRYLVNAYGNFVNSRFINHPTNVVIKDNLVFSSSYSGTDTTGGYINNRRDLPESVFRSTNTFGLNTIQRNDLPRSACGNASLFNGPGGPNATVNGHAGLTGGAQVIKAPSWW